MTKDVFNVGRFDPVRAIRKTLVIEDKPMRRGYRAAHIELNEM